MNTNIIKRCIKYSFLFLIIHLNLSVDGKNVKLDISDFIETDLNKINYKCTEAYYDKDDIVKIDQLVIPAICQKISNRLDIKLSEYYKSLPDICFEYRHYYCHCLDVINASNLINRPTA